MLLCVWLCAQTCWLVADNNTRGRVFAGLLTEEIPTVLSVSGLCVFLRLHVWLRQLFYSPACPLNPTLSCSSSDKGCAGQTLSRAPLSPSLLLHANNTHSSPLQANTIYMWKHLSYLQFTGAMAPKWVVVYMCEHNWEKPAWLNDYMAKSIFISILKLQISSFSSREMAMVLPNQRPPREEH